MKAIAFSKLQTAYPDVNVSIETSIGTRRADVLVTFPTPRQPLGHGIAVEVQHRNNSKDLFATDQDYYDEGYSVLWLSSQHYDGYDVAIDQVQPVWPNALPQLRGYDGLDWPIADTPTVVEIKVPLPQEYFAARETSLRSAYDRGVAQQQSRSTTSAQSAATSSSTSPSPSTDDWTTHKQVWLSKPHHRTKRSLQFVSSPSDHYYLKLSKGKRGQTPAYIHVRVTAADYDQLTQIPDLIHSALAATPSYGDWEEISKCWLTAYGSTVTAWLTLKSTPDNNYVLEMGKRTSDRDPESVTTGITLSAGLGDDLQLFVNGIAGWLRQ
jgi:hypothetical protein